MFCKKCGKELASSVKFCDGCGENQQASTASPLNAEIVNEVIGDGKKIFKNFFGGNPEKAIAEASSNHSRTGILLIITTVLLFSLVSCLNLTQAINHMIKATSSAISSTVNAMLGGALGSALTKQAIPSIEIPVLWDLFLPLTLLALAITAVLFVGIYITYKMKKERCKEFAMIANVIGVSSLPMLAALLVNFMIGFVLPQFTMPVFVAGVLVSLVALYDGSKNLFEVKKSPILEFAVLVLLICLVIAIASQIVVAEAGKIIQDTLMQMAGESLGGLGELFGSLFS